MGFFNKPTYKNFELKTRYYDREQEELEQNKRRWERIGNKDDNNEFDRESFRQEIKEKWESERKEKKGFLKATEKSKVYSDKKRLLILLLIAATLVYVIYKLGKNYGV